MYSSNSAFIILSQFLFFAAKQQGICGLKNHLDLHSCNSVVTLYTNESLKELFQGKKKQRISLDIALKRKNTEKGCAQDTYNPTTLYGECGVEKVIPLLPLFTAIPALYVKHLTRKTSEKGGLDYIFNGEKAVRYPTKQLPAYWYQQYTISGWILPQIHHDRHYLISWSDGDTPRHENTGFYVARRSGVDHMLFGFHHKHTDLSVECVVKEKWKLKVEEDVIWHFFTLSFKKCTVELTVDGKYLSPIGVGVGFSYRMPDEHIQPKFVIGARWAGSMTKYSDYFHGSISGLMMTYGDVLTLSALNCLQKCKEKLELSSKLPSGLQEEGVNGGQLIIEGIEGQNVFQNLLNDIIYINDNEYPQKCTRTISVSTTNRETKNVLKQEINIDIHREPFDISIQGNCGDQNNVSMLYKQGIKLCPNLKLVLNGCSHTLDMLSVSVLPEMSKKEKIFVPPVYLKHHQLSLFNTENGFVLHGVSGISQYMEVLNHIKYVYSGVLNGELSRTITVTVSSRNGLTTSNGFVMVLKASKESLHITPNSHVTKRLNPSGNFINLVKVEQPQGIYVNEKKKIARKSNRSSQNYVGWMALACGFSVVVILFMVGYGVRKRNRRQSLHSQYFLHDHHTVRNHHSMMDQPSLVSLTKNSEDISPDYYWDEEGLSMRLIINPYERISIINDPYSELLLKQKQCEESTTEGSIYSDEDLTDFETDSIRQLEWDCLQNSLDEILKEDKLKNGYKKKKDDFIDEVFL